MDERVLNELENVPYNGENAYLELEKIVTEKAEIMKISDAEKTRLDYELNLIKRLGIAKVFLFGYELCCSERLGTTCGAEGNSYVNYLLGISIVNPAFYNLPFERFFNEERKHLPGYYIIVEKGKKGNLLKSIYEKFGVNNIVKSEEQSEDYFISAKPIKPELIKESKIVAELNEEAYKENISVLSVIDLANLGFYGFSIKEVEKIEKLNKERFTEGEIYKKTMEISNEYMRGTEKFTEIKGVNKILDCTENKLIYQEQVIEILNEICGFELPICDYLRRELGKAKRITTEDVKSALVFRFGENGKNFYEYLMKSARYTISKAYVLANLHATIEFGD